jgi:hypothetical protein
MGFITLYRVEFDRENKDNDIRKFPLLWRLVPWNRRSSLEYTCESKFNDFDVPDRVVGKSYLFGRDSIFTYK